jgi:hypothetical protein
MFSEPLAGTRRLVRVTGKFESPSTTFFRNPRPTVRVFSALPLFEWGLLTAGLVPVLL